MLPGQKVDIPLPPETAEAFGCRSDARFVAFGWSYDHLTFDDGRSSGSANGWVFQGYARHRAVAPLLAGHDLGGADHAAPSLLLIDREKNLATISPAAEARSFLTSQHPAQQPFIPEQQEAFEREFEKLLAEHRARPVDHDAISREMAEQRGRVGRMMSFLDMCPTPPECGRK